MSGRFYPWRLAWASLLPRRTFLSLLTVLSLVGVLLGSMILFLVTAVMAGLESQIKEKILRFEPHLTVELGEEAAQWSEWQEKLKSVSGVVAVAPEMEGPVVVEFDHRRLVPTMRGVEELGEGLVAGEAEFSLRGEPLLESEEVVVGESVARRLGLRLGDSLTFYSPASLNDLLDEVERLEAQGAPREAYGELEEIILPQELVVTGIFATGRAEFDRNYLLVPLFIAQELYGLEDEVPALRLTLEEPYRADALKGEIAALLPEGAVVESWGDRHRPLFQAVAMERGMMSFLFFFIVVVAAFGIMNTLVAVAWQRRREIGVWRALGVPLRRVMEIFLIQGFCLGVVGMLCGLGAGVVVLVFRDDLHAAMASGLGLALLPGYAEIPARVDVSEWAAIALGTLLLCTLAALPPAWRAARFDPAEALRAPE